jgi:hypothetical protein
MRSSASLTMRKEPTKAEANRRAEDYSNGPQGAGSAGWEGLTDGFPDQNGRTG